MTKESQNPNATPILAGCGVLVLLGLGATVLLWWLVENRPWRESRGAPQGTYAEQPTDDAPRLTRSERRRLTAELERARQEFQVAQQHAYSDTSPENRDDLRELIAKKRAEVRELERRLGIK